VRSGAPAAVVLVRPDSPENVGLAARGMANTGFADLRVVGLDRFEAAAWRTAIHAESILESARFFPTLEAAAADRDLVLGRRPASAMTSRWSRSGRPTGPRSTRGDAPPSSSATRGRV
jgi:tRNA C32,U32 (ribose-2'-O)-methylase TrmJ